MARSGLGLAGSALAQSLSDWRDRLITDPEFQRWVARSPFTRWFARRRARALFDICAGFVYSQILSACVALDLFEIFRSGPKDCETVAERTGLDCEAALRLLKAAASLRLLKERPDGRFALDDLGAAMIGNPGVAAFVAHHDLLYADLADPVALLRGERETRLSRFWSYSRNRPGADGRSGAAGGHTAAYSSLMSRTQAMVAEAVLDAYPFARHRGLLDVAGGEGAFVAAAARRAPALALTLFDLPSVAERASQRIATLGLSRRVTIVGGDMLRDPLPKGADVVSLVRVLHDHDDESARAILAAVRDALPQNGTLVVAEPMAGVRGTEPMADAYFGFYLLAMGRGRPRSADEIAALLRAAGFGAERRFRTPTPLVVSVVAGRRV